MRVFCFLMVLVWLPAVVLGGERVVPEGLMVYAQLSGDGEEFKGVVRVSDKRVVYEVHGRFFEWGSFQDEGKRAAQDEAPVVLLKAAEAAKAGRAFEQVVWDDVQGLRKTVYESVQVDGVWRVRLSRAEESAVYEVKDVMRGLELLKEARGAAAWYRGLLVAEKLPVEREGVPRCAALFLSFAVGEVRSGDLIFRVRASGEVKAGVVSASSACGLLYEVKGGKLGHGGGGVQDLLRRMRLVESRLRDGKAFETGEVGQEGLRYRVDGNLRERLVNLVVLPKGNEPKVGRFSLKQMEELKRLEDAADDRVRWIRVNEGLFFRRVGE